MRRCVIVRAPLERVAKRHPEQVRVEVVQAVVHPGRRGTNEWLARPAAPVVLPDELVGEVGGESAAQFDRRSRRELVAVALGQERCHRFGWSRSPETVTPDRKSTRLNSSHEWISYAVFCLKKKKKKEKQ